MFTSQVINGKGKFASDSNKAPRNVRPGDGARVPGINQLQNCLKGNSYRSALVFHDIEAFVDIPIDTFD